MSNGLDDDFGSCWATVHGMTAAICAPVVKLCGALVEGVRRTVVVLELLVVDGLPAVVVLVVGVLLPHPARSIAKAIVARRLLIPAVPPRRPPPRRQAGSRSPLGSSSENDRHAALVAQDSLMLLTGRSRSRID